MNAERRVPGEPTDDDRMRAALDLAGPDPSAASLALVQRVSRVRSKRGLAVLLVVVAVGACRGVLLAMRDRPWRSDPVDTWRSVLGWTLYASGFGGLVWSFVSLRRSGRPRWVRARARPFTVLTVAQRKHVTRQIQGKAAVEPAHLPLLRYVATTMTGSPLSPWMLVAVAALLVGNAIRTDDPVPWVVAGSVAVVTVGTIPAASRLYRRAKAFLATHPDPTPKATP